MWGNILPGLIILTCWITVSLTCSRILSGKQLAMLTAWVFFVNVYRIQASILCKIFEDKGLTYILESDTC